VVLAVMSEILCFRAWLLVLRSITDCHISEDSIKEIKGVDVGNRMWRCGLHSSRPEQVQCWNEYGSSGPVRFSAGTRVTG